MTKASVGLILIFTAISIDRLCSHLPSNPYFDPFPFYDLMYCYPDTHECVNRGVNVQYYCKAITNHAGLIMIMFAFRALMSTFTQSFSRLFIAFAVIEFLSLADFLLIYEQSFFSLGNYPVEFTDFKIIGYLLSIIAWRTLK